MASATKQGAQMLNGWKKLGRFDTGLAAELPQSYKKFWNEWKTQLPAAVHYIPKEGSFERNEQTGIVTPIQNVPIPTKKVPEEDLGIWGGESIVKGFQKRDPYKRRVPHFWVPVLRRSAVRSDVLGKHFSLTVTDRTIEQIHSSQGFDHYILKTPACDLRSALALRMKREILQELQAGCPSHKEQPKKQQELLKEYKQYVEQYTAEEIEWYGYTFKEAIMKIGKEIKDKHPVVPHKIIFRRRLIEQLHEAGIQEVTESLEAQEPSSSSWMNKINPFAKKET